MSLAGARIELPALMQGEISDAEFKQYFDQFGDIEDCVVRPWLCAAPACQARRAGCSAWASQAPVELSCPCQPPERHVRHLPHPCVASHCNLGSGGCLNGLIAEGQPPHEQALWQSTPPTRCALCRCCARRTARRAALALSPSEMRCPWRSAWSCSTTSTGAQWSSSAPSRRWAPAALPCAACTQARLGKVLRQPAGQQVGQSWGWAAGCGGTAQHMSGPPILAVMLVHKLSWPRRLISLQGSKPGAGL